MIQTYITSPLAVHRRPPLLNPSRVEMADACSTYFPGHLCTTPYHPAPGTSLPEVGDARSIFCPPAPPTAGHAPLSA